MVSPVVVSRWYVTYVNSVSTLTRWKSLVRVQCRPPEPVYTLATPGNLRRFQGLLCFLCRGLPGFPDACCTGFCTASFDACK